MGNNISFDATLTPRRGRVFPKKVLKHSKIQITDNYTFQVCVWIADTPESNMKPTINLVLSHSNQKFRFCFNSVQDMVEAITQMKDCLLDWSFIVHDAYNEALREFIEHHEQKRLITLNDNTNNTVIQDITKNKYSPDREFVNTKTGEIIELYEKKDASKQKRRRIRVDKKPLKRNEGMNDTNL